MIPYAPATRTGRKTGGHKVHHRTADNPKSVARAAAKALRHAARQEGRRLADEAEV